MTLDSPTQAYIDKIRSTGYPPLSALGPAKARAATAAMSKTYASGPAVASRAIVDIDDPPAKALVLVPEGDVRGLVVHFHGGGWVVGSPEEYEAFGRHLAVQSGCAVALPWYRLAPEHPAPAAAKDAWRAVVGLSEHIPAMVGVDLLPLIVSGDSAGGHLAIGVTQRARDEGSPTIDHQVLIYPMIDPSMSSGSYYDPANQLIFDRNLLTWFWDQYAPTEEHKSRSDVAVGGQDPSSLPSATVITAEHDVLREEGEEYASSLQAAGVPVRLERMDGQAHGFITMIGLLPASAAGIDIVAAEIDRVLAADTVNK